ncbi:MAG: DUF1566 domain-containing protein [Desulfobacterium sp.]|nr:DUF1566 domain-containing protein [Desulfobacterium sp.]
MSLFQTDQIQCYDAKGQIIPCTGTGQDGDTRKGKAWPKPRFIEHKKIVTDRLTNLIWARDAGLSDFPLSWPEAFGFVKQMNAAGQYGLNQWRLPSRSELFSLISHDRVNPAIVQSDLFFNIFNGYYWTATPCARYSDQAWYVHLGGGRVVKGMIHGSYMVWPVHDSTPQNDKPGKNKVSPQNRFVLSEDMVVDQVTGLSWLQDADFLEKEVTWSEALIGIKLINQEKRAGYKDWRLPNIRELESLIDINTHSPAIAGKHLFKSLRPFYWSSTTSCYEPSYAWTLYTQDGNIGVGYKPHPEFHVWPVRGE